MSASLILSQTILPLPNDIPSSSVKHIRVKETPFIIYPSGDGLVVLDSAMELVSTLSFSMGFHGVGKGAREGSIGGLAVDEEKGLIIASLDSHIVIFTPILSTFPDPASIRSSSSRLRPSWKIHSTMTTPREGPITSLDYHQGKILVASRGSLALWSSDMDDGMGLWSRVWEDSLDTRLPLVDWSTFDPSGGFATILSRNEKTLRIIKIDKSGELEDRSAGQTVKFARPIKGVWWRSSTKDPTPLLYTLTGASTIHIHSPVLDDPNHFQLWSTVSPPLSSSPCSTLFPLNASELRRGIETALANETGDDLGRRKMLEEIGGEGATLGDLFVGVERDGGGVKIWSVVNMERRPPTLLKVLKLLHHHSPFLRSTTGPQISPLASYTLVALPRPSPPRPSSTPSTSSISSLPAPSLLLISHTPARPIIPLHLTPSTLFDPSSTASSRSSFTPLPDLKDPILGLNQPVREFFRTPNGRGLISLGEDGECVAWGLEAYRSKKGKGRDGLWRARGRWKAEEGVALMALFARGRSIATYHPSTSSITICYLRPSLHSSLLHLSPATSPLPGLSPSHRLTTLVALSDIDDGVSTATKLPTTSYLIASTPTAFVYIWRLDAGDPARRGEKEGEPTATLVSSYLLPYRSEPASGDVGEDGEGDEPAFVMSVDPMGWHESVIDWKERVPLQDMLVVVTKDGELSYWTPRLGYVEGEKGEGKEPWVRTGVVKTGKKGVVMARCSSRKKTAMVVSTPEGNEVSIWDSKSSEFDSGLEFVKTYDTSSPVNDLDWTTTADLQSVLAVGFKTNVVLLAEQRMSYVEEDGSYWDTVLKIEIESLTPHPISDSIWLANGSLAVAAGNQVFIHSRFLSRSKEMSSNAPQDVFELVALGNGPLVDYHPQLLLQCMLWNKIELVKSIVTRLHLAIEAALNQGKDEMDWPRMDVSEFFGSGPARKRDLPKVNGGAHSRYNSLFDDDPTPDEDDGNGFTRSLVSNLIDHLESSFPLPLSSHEREHLLTLVQTLLEIDEQSRALDVSGLRYLISLRFYVIWKKRLPPSGSLTPASEGTEAPHSHHQKERLSFRNVVWAFHSQSQDILLTAATAASGGKMMLRNAKALGVFLWLRSPEVLRAQVEIVARNQYMQGDDRDPASCSLLYFALGKVKLVHGLWKQAAWHPEQKVMLKFLSNDFNLPRWRTAALKNAFALLSKQRHEYAAAFFLLGGSVKDAVNVCLRQLNDWQLAVAIARVVEGDDGPVLRGILQNTLVPLAFSGGHRWLGTWAFWMLRRRDLAVRILITPLKDLQPSVDFPVPVVGESNDDDPSLALLFSQLRSLTLQTAKGTSEIPEKTEFNFVLHNARVFGRMGCHVLALDLVRSWTFLKPEVIPDEEPLPSQAVSDSSEGEENLDERDPIAPLRSTTDRQLEPPKVLRRPSFLLGGTRRSSIIIDMDLPSSLPPSRAASPAEKPPAVAPVGGDAPSDVVDLAAIARRKGLGSLMKSAKEDAKQGAADFDMSAFGF